MRDGPLPGESVYKVPGRTGQSRETEKFSLIRFTLRFNVVCGSNTYNNGYGDYIIYYLILDSFESTGVVNPGGTVVKKPPTHAGDARDASQVDPLSRK